MGDSFVIRIRRSRRSARDVLRVGLASGIFGSVLAASVAAAAPTLPANFVPENAVPNVTFDTPTAIAFLPGGRMLVAEKRGVVWTVTNGARAATPLFQRENEVLNEGDCGLLGMAVDPNYVTNHFVYFLFTADPDSNGVDTDPLAFGRLVRYAVSATDSNTVDYSTRAVLMGVSWRYGPLTCSLSHSIGSLRFGRDGSLLFSAGEGASYDYADNGGHHPAAFGSDPNHTDPFEDIGAYRAQSLSCLGGKILRVNPVDGRGYPSNPYWDGNGSSVRSRVWAYGLRNPFRFCVRPGTGSTDPAAGNPGTLMIGDVGWGHWDDMNVLRSGGANFGWPCYEGPDTQDNYEQAGPPAHNGCGSMGTPDNPAGNSPPAASWNHDDPSASIPPGSAGNCAIGGVFYTGSRYPAQYQGAYFFADYGQDWIKVATFGATDQLLSIANFGTNADGPVDFAVDPVNGDVIYVSINTGLVRRLRWTGSDPSGPPVAVAGGTPTSGNAPLTVTFSSNGSIDPDGGPLTYSWNFGDATGSSLASPVHTYAQAGAYDAVLTVTDITTAIGRDTVQIVATPPGGFPTAGVLDNFNRANGPLAAPWVDVNGTTTLAVSNSTLIETGSSSSVIWDGSGAVFGPNQEAFVTLNAIATSPQEHDLLLKVQGTTWMSGCIEVWYDKIASRVSVETFALGQDWQSRGSIQPVTFNPGDQFGARALANGSVQVFRNGQPLGTVSVSAWPFASGGGRIGLWLIGASGSVLDNYGGGDMVTSTNTAPTATIISPLDNSFYGDGQVISLVGVGSDTQDPPAALAYKWRFDLHHNNHIHPSTFLSTSRIDSLIGQNHDDGTGVWMQGFFIVTDTGGMADTAVVHLYPDVDVRPTSFSTDPALVRVGGSAAYQLTIVNNGRMPCPIVHWQVVSGTTTVAEGDTVVPGLDSVRVSRSFPTTLSPGSYTVSLVVDSLNTVVESNEANNHGLGTLTVVPVLDAGDVPLSLALSGPVPNPSTHGSRLSLTLPSASPVAFEIFDLQGRSVWRAPRRSFPAGRSELRWPGVNQRGDRVRPGVYLARVDVDSGRFVRRIAMMP
jgi:glucose/arabinose dehydrogenase